MRSTTVATYNDKTTILATHFHGFIYRAVLIIWTSCTAWRSVQTKCCSVHFSTKKLVFGHSDINNFWPSVHKFTLKFSNSSMHDQLIMQRITDSFGKMEQRAKHQPNKCVTPTFPTVDYSDFITQKKIVYTFYQHNTEEKHVMRNQLL